MSDKSTFRKAVEFTNVRELVEWSGETFGESTAYSFKRNPAHGEIERVSYANFRNDVRALASSLIRMGAAGKHCALIAKPSYEWIITYFAVLSSGAVLVPLDRDWLAEDLADTVSKADADFLFYESDIADKAEVISSKTSLLGSFVLDSEEGLEKLIEDGRIISEKTPMLT